MRSIRRKVGKNISEIKSSIALEHPTAIDLALHLRQFGETLDAVSEELLPNRLADYLYNLAEKFHAFFRDPDSKACHNRTAALFSVKHSSHSVQGSSDFRS